MKTTNQPAKRPGASDFADAWPGVVMIIVASAAILLTIFGVASRSAVLWGPTVLLIVVAALAYTAAAKQRRRRRGQAASSEREQRLEQEVAELRARVETLERIVTDDGYDLKRELANLEAEQA